MDLDGIVREAVRWDTAAWMETSGMIADDEGNIRRPTCNEFQREVSDIIKYCHEAQRPCRIIILKPRRKGSSTVSVAAGYNRLQAKRATGCIAGGSHYQGGKLFDMLRIYADNDDMRPKTAKVQDMVARFTNGSSMDRLTLANAAAGRSGGYQFLVITEMALLSNEGVANAPAVVSGLLKTVKFLPDTIVILESTASGAAGDYYERYQKAITFDEFKAGKAGFIKVFYPWFAFSDSRIDPAVEGIHSEDDYTAFEREYAERWGLDMHQMAWMRMTLRDDCNGNFDKFQEDYPSDEHSAFLRSGRARFSVEGMEYQDYITSIRPREFGVLEYSEAADQVRFVSTTEHQARCVRWETPKIGCRYLICVDPMTGASQTGGEDPDSHAVFAIRDGYVEGGVWHEPAVVMRNILVPDGQRFGCWWDIDVLEEEVWRMAKYWQAVIVPEMNMDRGLVELLKLRGDVDIYERELFNRREQVKTKALGWTTDTKTRPMIIEGLARSIRESGRGAFGEGFEVRCPWALKQMRNFVVKPNGRAEAANGHHDDDVLALAIGLACIDSAVPYREVERVGSLYSRLHGGVLRPAVKKVGQYG